MSDLLSRDAVLASRPEYLNPCCEGSEEYNKGWNDCLSLFYRTIKELPPSYDLDGVVEQLKEKRAAATIIERGNGQVSDFHRGRACGIIEAFKTVKGGIKDENA